MPDTIVVFSTPPPPDTGALMPRPYDRTTPLRDRSTGYVFTGGFSGEPVRYLPAPPHGEQWRPHPWGYGNGAYRFHILTSDEPDIFWSHRVLIGCSVTECDGYCIWRDGCPDCNPDEWHWCLTGNCGGEGTEEGRISNDDYDPDDCSCLTTCDECQDRYRHTSSCEVEGTGEVDLCDGCRNGYFTYCDPCDVWWRDDDGHDCPRDSESESGMAACGCCPVRSELINYYSYKPFPRFHGEGPAFLGVEIEINTEDASLREVAEYVASQVGDVAYMKEDSSIGTGFELVTHPMSYPWALENFPWAMFNELRNRWGIRNNTSCGLHVHVSRAAFADARHSYRWLKFVYRSHAQLTKLSRRREYDLSEWGGFKPASRAWAIHHAKAGPAAIQSDSWIGRKSAWWVKADRRNQHGSPSYVDRYSAVNAQNEETFEVRFFAGSVYQSQVKAAMGFVHASVEYTRTLTAHDILTGNGWDWTSFVTWLSDNPMYADLRREIERLV